jgi:hypothetical protein
VNENSSFLRGEEEGGASIHVSSKVIPLCSLTINFPLLTRNKIWNILW